MTTADENKQDALLSFARWVVRECVFEGSDLPWDAVSDEAQERGIITAVAFDPAVHGSCGEAEPGDEIFVFSEWMKAQP